ncbi:MAG: 16S rRNA (guanine(527)-N(7))-methyltransferase RsmG [Chloroflexi bacterium]|nr:16S rRNA (guanine(527)-N(7))-methyltransferase RsmG [Chloroflexota bacterium]
MRSLASAALSLLDLTLTSAQLAAFQAYADELVEWNAKFNLTAITDPEGIQIKHFLDSLACRLAFRAASASPAATVIDIGTGAGFPGIPLKIVCPAIRLTLVEATGKKVKFLEHIIARLGLSGVTAVKARAEEIGRDPAHRERYDWAVARAVAEMPTLVEYLLPLVRLGGKCLAQKGEGAPAETQTAEKALRILGGQLNQLIAVELPGVAETRYLVVVDKVAATPAKYPRRAGTPGKAPLK